MEILEKDLKMVNGTAMTISMCSVTMDMKVDIHYKHAVMISKEKRFYTLSFITD